MDARSGAIEPVSLDASGFRFSGLAAGSQDGPLVILLHGWPQFADSWSEVLRELGAAGYRAVAIDQRGYSNGARPEPLEAYAIGELVNDVTGFADALGAERFHLVTHDWGAIVGWHVAAAFPDRVASFVALAVPHPNALAEAMENDPDQQQRGAYVQLFRAPGNVAEKALLGSDAAALRAAYEGKVAPATVDENVRRMREPGALTATLNWYRAFDWGATLAPVTVPTLFVWASNDRAVGERAARNNAPNVTGPYRFETVPTTHWIVDEIPSEIVALMLPHLAEHAAPALASASGSSGRKH